MPKPSKMTCRVFISYSRTDFTTAEQIQNRLTEGGHDAWLDRNIRAGQEWWNVITKEIRRRDILIFLVSKHSTASAVCRAELKYAIELRRTVIPIIVDRINFDELPDQLRSRHSLEYTGQPADKERLLRAVSDAQVEALPDPLPTPPRLPASLPPTGSAFFDSRFRADLEHIRQLIERREWKEADERTRDALLGLAGLAALKRGYLSASMYGDGEDEVRSLPCDGLEALASVWATADPPIDEELREAEFSWQLAPAKIEYPTVWVRRKAEVETPLYDEMRALKAHCQECGVELFLFYARPDGELIFVPERVLNQRLAELASPAATSLLRFCSFLLSFVDYSIDQLALGAGMIDEDVAAFVRKSRKPANGLRRLVQSLWSQNLVRNFDGASFKDHGYIGHFLRSQMDETERILWGERVSEVLEYLTTRVPVGDHWLKAEVERQLEVLSYKSPVFRRPSATEIPKIEALRNWLRSAEA